MAVVSITENRLTVELHGWRRVLALKHRILVPMEHVRGATMDDGVLQEPKGVRAPGLHLPGIALGSFHRDGDWTFWEADVRDRPVVVELTGERYARLVLRVDDPRAVVDEINRVVAASA